MNWIHYIYHPIFLGFVWLVLTKVIGYRAFYRIGWWSLLFRSILLNLYSVATLLAFTIVGTLLDYWTFILNWGVRDFFLATLVIEFPIVYFALPKSPFKKKFSSVVLVDFFAVLVTSMLVVYIPPAVGIMHQGTSKFYPGLESGFHEIIDALEKYKQDKGCYPSYIYGGDRLSWMKIEGEILDPLLSENYLQNYPRNNLNLETAYFLPRRAPGWIALFLGRKSTEFIELYNTWYFTLREDPRFGFHGTKMANILSDPSIPKSFQYGDYRLIKKGYQSGQDYILPGGLIYRAFDMNGDNRADAFFLALLGGENEKGLDLYERNRNLAGERIKLVDGTMKLRRTPDGIPDGIIDVYYGGKGFWAGISN